MKRPKTYLVKVSKSSIRGNPDYPRPRPVLINTRVTVTAQYIGKEAPPPVISTLGFYFQLSSYNINTKEKVSCVYEGAILKEVENPEELFLQHGLKISGWKVSNQYQEMDYITAPSPYLYDYKRKKVQCYNCKANIWHDELQTDYSDCGDYCRDNVCPKCDRADCCDVEYEKLDIRDLNRLK